MSLSRQTIDETLRSPYGEAAYKVVEKLTDAGYEAWWTGGCVRDMLQGKLPKDIDIATSALPEEIAQFFLGLDASASALGNMRVKSGKFFFEVTTFREDDDASDGRHPEAVSFGTREQDAKRRDFTVNALYFHPISRELYDPWSGEVDLRERLIRFIGEPGVRIKHDALRILRAVRFRALLDGQYHPDTYAALRELASSVDILSGFRKLEEFEKMLAGARPWRALEDLWELSILRRFLPELAACKGIPQPSDYHREGDVWEHMLLLTKAFIPEHGPDIRLAAIFHDCGKAQTFSLKERIRFDEHASVSAGLASRALERLQCPLKRREKIAWMIEHHMMMGSFASMSDERKAHWYFHPWFRELLQLMWLDIAGTDPADYSLYEDIVRDYQSFLDRHPRPEKALLSGGDIMAILGLQPGAEVGRVLKELHDAQLRGEITTKREARAYLEKRKH